MRQSFGEGDGNNGADSSVKSEFPVLSPSLLAALLRGS